MPRARPLLAAALIVRDEAGVLGDCLAGVRDLVDEVVIYDTGSTDGTPELAVSTGARVLRGYWDGDFARARNAALSMTRARWVLSIDADERLVSDRVGLRERLRVGFPDTDALLVRLAQLGPDGDERLVQLVSRLFRPERAHWQGRVHEVLVTRPERDRVPLPPWLVRLEHLGYPDAATVAAKARRNLELARAELDDLVRSRSADRDRIARVLFDLARSFSAVGRRQEAVDALEAVRDAVGTGVRRAMATALLAQILIETAGFDQVGLALVDELERDGWTDPRQVAWIRAQGLARLGHPAEALAL